MIRELQKIKTMFYIYHLHLSTYEAVSKLKEVLTDSEIADAFIREDGCWMIIFYKNKRWQMCFGKNECESNDIKVYNFSRFNEIYYQDMCDTVIFKSNKSIIAFNIHSKRYNDLKDLVEYVQSKSNNNEWYVY